MSPKGTVTSTSRRGRDQRAHEIELDARIERHVEQQQRSGRSEDRGTAGRAATSVAVPKQRRAVRGRCRRRTAPRTSRAAPARSGPPSGSVGERGRRGRAASRSSCSVRRQRAGEPGRLRHRLEVTRARPSCSRVEGGARGDRLGAQSGRRRPPIAARTGAASRAASWVRLKRWRPIVAPARDRDRPREIVGRAARCRRRSGRRRVAIASLTKARASASRSSVADDSTTRMWGDRCEGAGHLNSFPDAVPGHRDRPRDAAVMNEDIVSKK